MGVTLPPEVLMGSLAATGPVIVALVPTLVIDGAVVGVLVWSVVST